MKTVCILGMAPTTRDLVMEEPEGPEIWGLNQAHIYYPPEQLARFTRWFQIHPWDEMVMVQRPEHHHLDFLATCPVPVFLHEERTEVPLGVRYPIEEVRANLGRDYLTGGPSYMLALAIYEGFHRIKIYGMDMANSTEYFEQRPCFEWLIGVAEGRGIEVWLPEGSSIMRGAGYARAYNISSSLVKEHLRDLYKELEAKIAEWNAIRGAINGFENLLAQAVKGTPHRADTR